MTTDFGRLRSAALRAEPNLRSSQAKPAAAIAGFRLKSWDVTVEGYGVERIVASSRGKALAKAWRCDAFGRLTFGDFLKIASAWRAMLVSEDFGAPITVEGRSAFFVSRNRAYVQIAYPGGDCVLSAHPYDVEPQCFRPEAYRTASVDRSPEGGDRGTGRHAEHESAVGEAETPTLSRPQGSKL